MQLKFVRRIRLLIFCVRGSICRKSQSIPWPQNPSKTGLNTERMTARTRRCRTGILLFFHLLKEHDMTCMPCNYVVLMASNFSSIDLINYWVRKFQRESPCTKHQSSIHMTDNINYLSISYIFFPHSIRIK